MEKDASLQSDFVKVGRGIQINFQERRLFKHDFRASGWQLKRSGPPLPRGQLMVEFNPVFKLEQMSISSIEARVTRVYPGQYLAEYLEDRQHLLPEPSDLVNDKNCRVRLLFEGTQWVYNEHLFFPSLRLIVDGNKERQHSWEFGTFECHDLSSVDNLWSVGLQPVIEGDQSLFW